MNERYCPKCGKFKTLSAPLCDHCIKGTEENYNTGNPKCPKCNIRTSPDGQLCNRCKIEQLIKDKELERNLDKENIDTEIQIKISTPKKAPRKAAKKPAVKPAAKPQSTTQTAPTNSFHQKYDSKNIYKCKCGIYVKSKDERTIADFLYENGIPFQYEVEHQYLETKLQWHNAYLRSLYPDFFIKGPVEFQGKKIENVYIEYWGLDTEEYLERKAYKLKVYEHYHSTLISIYPEDLYDFENNLTRKLTEFTDREINY